MYWGGGGELVFIIITVLALLLSFHLVTGFKGVTTEEERVSVCQRTCRGPRVVFEACCNEISQILVSMVIAPNDP